MEFAVTAQQENAITFTLVSSKETLASYPFLFRLSLQYSLSGSKLSVTYIVENTGVEKLLFSVGGHPAFKIPLAEATVFEDYYLQFNAIEDAGRWPLSADGLIENFTFSVLESTDKLPLSKSLFYEDAFVFKQLRSNSISILSNKTTHGLKVNFAGFPYVGIWNAKGANFLCIEPWCGIADSVLATGNLEDKEGINNLTPTQIFERTWSVELF